MLHCAIGLNQPTRDYAPPSEYRGRPTTPPLPPPPSARYADYPPRTGGSEQASARYRYGRYCIPTSINKILRVYTVVALKVPLLARRVLAIALVATSTIQLILLRRTLPLVLLTMVLAAILVMVMPVVRPALLRLEVAVAAGTGTILRATASMVTREGPEHLLHLRYRD